MSDIGPGDVVVCVDGSRGFGRSAPDDVYPQAGRRYVVEAVFYCEMWRSAGLVIAGCPRGKGPSRDGVIGWGLRRFRKANSGDHAETIRSALKVTPRPTVDA